MITTFDQLYLEIAKLAKASGNEQMFKTALNNRLRTLKKEKELRLRQDNVVPVVTPTKEFDFSTL